MSAGRLSEAEELRLSAWAGLAGCASFAWTLFAATTEPSDFDVRWLVAGVGITLAAVGLTGGVIVPRRKSSWTALLFECGVGAGAISIGTVFATAWADEDHPAALGFWGLSTFVASAVVITPLFLSAFAGRAGLLRILHRA